jgi:hypothetical protein
LAQSAHSGWRGFTRSMYKCGRSFDRSVLRGQYYLHRRSRHLVTQDIPKDESVEQDRQAPDATIYR